MNSNKKKAGILSAIALSFIVASGCSAGNTIVLDSNSSGGQSTIPTTSINTTVQSTSQAVTSAESTAETMQTAQTTQTSLSLVTEETKKPVKNEWTESKASGEKYVTVDCYSRKKAVLGAETVKLYKVNEKVKIVATTNTGYSKLEDGSFIHNDYLSDSKVSVTVATTTQKPATSTVKPTATPSKAQYEWVIKPSYDYDDVEMITRFDVPVSKVYTNASDQYDDFGPDRKVFTAVIAENNKKCALMDFSGDLYTDFLYDDIIETPAGTLNMRIYDEPNEYGYASYSAYALDINFKICDAYQGYGDWGLSYIVYNKTTNKFYDCSFNVEEINDISDVSVLVYSHAPDNYDVKVDYSLLEKTGKFGYLKDGKFIVPCEYDYALTESESRIVLCKNSKIYVFDTANGKCYSNGVYDKVDNGNQELCYLNGYLTVCKNGKWGLLDVNGKEVVKCQFEDISSVYNGKAWAKQNGKWGVIKLA